MIRKNMIICKLLMSDYEIFYPYTTKLKPYFSLIGAVKRAEISNFYSILDEYKEEFFGMNLYFIIRKLVGNVLHEGLRKIASSYSKISVADICSILQVNVDFLIHSMIKEKFIKGFVHDGIFYSSTYVPSRIHLGERIAEAVNLRKTIRSMMKYPEIVPLTYERVMEIELSKEQ